MRNLFKLLLLPLLAALVLAAALPVLAQEGKSAVVIVANKDFQYKEYKKTRSELEDGGVTVTVAAPEAGRARSDDGLGIDVELALAEVDVSAFDAVVFIGGKGSKNELVDNPEAHRIANEAVEQGKVLGAICYAPVVLANAGVLDGRTATSADAWEAHDIMESRGCTVESDRVVVDGLLVTGDGPRAASRFGEALVEVLAQ